MPSRLPFALAGLLTILPAARAADVPLSVGRVALSVRETDERLLDEVIRGALASDDARLRAAGAHVAMVRARSGFAAALGEQLDREGDARAAREEARALVLLGGKKDVARALAASAKMQHRLDAAIASAVGRLGADNALPLFFDSLRTLKSTPHTNFFTLALWGAPALITPTASKLLELGDAESWANLVEALDASSISLETKVGRAALAHSSVAIREKTADLLIDSLTDPIARVPDALKDFLKTREAEVSPSVAFRREMIRRLLGEHPQTDPEWIPWLVTAEGLELVQRSRKIEELLTGEEAAAVRRLKKRQFGLVENGAPGRLDPPPYYLPSAMPDGMADAVIAEVGCTDSWIGVVATKIDRQGRVLSTDLSKVITSGRCKEALDAVLRLSLANNTSILSPLASGSTLAIKPKKRGLCLDEGAVPAENELDLASCNPLVIDAGHAGCNPPKVRKRIEPEFPTNARYAMHGRGEAKVVVEAIVTETGCVRQANLIQQSDLGALNASALIAISQWLFDPARRDGIAVPVIFRLEVNFKLN